MTTRLALAAFALVACIALASCSSSDGGPGPGDTTPPDVSQANLTDGQTDVGLVHRISVTFSEDMDETTIDSTTVSVAGRAPAGYVDYDDETHTVTYTPDTLYAAQAWHSFTLSDEITDEAGNAIDEETISFETGSLDCEHLGDYMEPNETFEESAHLEVDRWYRSLTMCPGDEDWFSFTVTETAMVTLLERLKHADDTNWARYFERGDDERYVTSGTSPESGDSLSYFHFTFHPGTYYLRVTTQTSSYVLADFKLETGPPCDDDQYEDNDFPDEAEPIGEGTITGLQACWLDRDFFSIDLEAGETLTVTATSGPSDGTRRVSIYNPSEQSIASQTSSANPMTVSATASESGVYYFKIRFWKDDVDYEVDVDVN
jgi:hypothetical protein